MITRPKITVITVTYNCAAVVEQTICSILEQTYSEVEYIIIDGGSTDGTLDIIRRYTNRIAYFVSEPDKGIYDAMNKGILVSTGEWLNFMNAGDLFVSKDILQRMVEEIIPGNYILRGNIIRIYPKFKVKSVGVTVQEPSLMDMFNNTFHHQACLIHASLFKKFGLYSTDYKLCSDWKFFFDCIVLHNVKSKYIDLTVACFKMDGASTNNSILYLKEQESYLKLVYGEELFNLFRELNIYRKSKIISSYYKLRLYIITHLSQQNFNRLLILKRLFRKMLGFDVN